MSSPDARSWWLLTASLCAFVCVSSYYLRELSHDMSRILERHERTKDELMQHSCALKVLIRDSEERELKWFDCYKEEALLDGLGRR